MSAVLSEGRCFAPTASACFHCGLPLPSNARWPVVIDQVEQPMCCPGCQSVAQAIVDNGLTDYYQTRSAYCDTADRDALVPPELQLYDAPEARAQYASDDSGGSEILLSVEGMRCAACAWLIERRLMRLPGVRSADMNVATEKLHLRWNDEACKLGDILRSIGEIGYRAWPYDAARHEERLRRDAKTMFRQLFLAGLSMMQVMMYAVPAYMAGEGGIEADMTALMRWASLLLTLPAVCYSARPFFAGALADLRHRRLGMDVPVALGIAAAFIGSMAALWSGTGEVYFDSVTMFIFLLLCSRYFELLARRKAATAVTGLQHALPASALRLPHYPASRETELVAAAQLCTGDVILIKPGETIAADGVVLEGASAIDAALLTGESRPQHKAVNDDVPGGAVNVSQAMLLRVQRPLQDSTLAALLKLSERAGLAKPQLALWADRVAAWFVGSLLLFAVAVFLFWHLHDPARAWPIAIAVLVVSCPCALSLATPTALAAATDRLLRRGVLVVQPHVLESLYRATHVVFDKTGTLTMGKPVLRQMQTFDGAQEASCLRIAAALEAGSAHPLAQALAAAARQANAGAADADGVTQSAGRGVEGVVDGLSYRLGSAAFVTEWSGAPPSDASAPGATPVYLGTTGRWLARFDLADAVREDASAVVAQFRKLGKEVILLSGDRQETAAHVAAELGIDAVNATHGDRLPEQKLAFVRDLQARGARVAMVGDGVNDAAVMRVADVSFAMGGGAALAQVHADGVLLSGRLSALAEAARTAGKTMAVIRQNLAWATLYNMVAIPAAALGWLNPWLSGVGMALSSALVVANALRLRR